MRFLICLPMLMLIAAAPATQPSMDEQCKALAASWKDRLAAEKFDTLIAPPFVIAGNTGPRQLAGYRDSTILASKNALSAMYFKTPVDKPILIVLFADADSYKTLCLKWFDAKDLPHYGMYRHRDRTMLMNISTGGGTLVHEMTHALIAADFPDVPEWFNEGFASLYEQCDIRNNKIQGFTNWRLPKLQEAIKAGTLQPLEKLISDDDFRNDEREGLNYAQARYLMYYLQQQGKLVDFYKKFRDTSDKDPTGIETLKAILKPEDLDTFDKRWQKWVLTLKFGN
jgi:hypothetical protein